VRVRLAPLLVYEADYGTRERVPFRWVGCFRWVGWGLAKGGRADSITHPATMKLREDGAPGLVGDSFVRLRGVTRSVTRPRAKALCMGGGYRGLKPAATPRTNASSAERWRMRCGWLLACMNARPSDWVGCFRWVRPCLAKGGRAGLDDPPCHDETVSRMGYPVWWVAFGGVGRA
jgi:hypothetical protein